MSKTVFVGLSGGVDSAVSAALLKERGFNVVGAFIKIWRPEFIECTWKEDRLDAMRVAAALGIPFKEIDLSDEYKKEVVDPMIENYRNGITPNPDVLCNRHIKFGAFAKWAFAEGADMVATGHYARIENHGSKHQLLRGVDTSKDQSYFLYRLDTHDLARTLFPIGNIEKKQVRALAQKYELPVAEKADSQGLCIIGDISMRDALARFIPVEEGKVLDGEGEVIGTHEGAALYTVGQRHGFIVAGERGQVPHYVTHIDVATNTITVSAERNAAARLEISLRDMHWVNTAPAMPAQVQVQTRYRETPIDAEVSLHDEKVHIHFNEPHIASPGQSLVIYHGDICLGGGVIC
jgi:tRNA-specific 2-thiouridylase